MFAVIAAKKAQAAISQIFSQASFTVSLAQKLLRKYRKEFDKLISWDNAILAFNDKPEKYLKPNAWFRIFLRRKNRL